MILKAVGYILYEYIHLVYCIYSYVYNIGIKRNRSIKRNRIVFFYHFNTIRMTLYLYSYNVFHFMLDIKHMVFIFRDYSYTRTYSLISFHPLNNNTCHGGNKNSIRLKLGPLTSANIFIQVVWTNTLVRNWKQTCSQQMFAWDKSVFTKCSYENKMFSCNVLMKTKCSHAMLSWKQIVGTKWSHEIKISWWSIVFLVKSPSILYIWDSNVFHMLSYQITWKNKNKHKNLGNATKLYWTTIHSDTIHLDKTHRDILHRVLRQNSSSHICCYLC